MIKRNDVYIYYGSSLKLIGCSLKIINPNAPSDRYDRALRIVVLDGECKGQERVYSHEWFLKNTGRVRTNAGAHGYILWNPSSSKPPRKVFSTYADALSVKNTWQYGHMCHIMAFTSSINKAYYEVSAEYRGMRNKLDPMIRTDIAQVELRTIADILNKGNNDMIIANNSNVQVVTLLTVKGKTIELTEAQAKSFKKLDSDYLRKAFKVDGKYYTAEELKVKVKA